MLREKVFKSKDSSITDDDIDLILVSGGEKTKGLNENLLDADKGDILDFKINGGSGSLYVQGSKLGKRLKRQKSK